MGLLQLLWIRLLRFFRLLRLFLPCSQIVASRKPPKKWLPTSSSSTLALQFWSMFLNTSFWHLDLFKISAPNRFWLGGLGLCLWFGLGFWDLPTRVTRKTTVWTERLWFLSPGFSFQLLRIWQKVAIPTFSNDPTETPHLNPPFRPNSRWSPGSFRVTSAVDFWPQMGPSSLKNASFGS